MRWKPKRKSSCPLLPLPDGRSGRTDDDKHTHRPKRLYGRRHLNRQRCREKGASPMHRLLEKLDGAASTLVPLAYLAGMLIGTAAYFSGVVLEAGVAVGIALAIAVEMHGFLAQRRLRATWSHLASVAADDPQRASLTAQLRANVVVLGILIVLSMYNGAAFLSRPWPLVDNFLPAGFQIAIRATILPLLFLASGFLTPLHTSAGDVLASASREMLHSTVRATRKQWRERITRAQRQGLDLAPVAIALMKDAGDLEGARRIRLISDGLNAAETGNATSTEVPPPDAPTPGKRRSIRVVPLPAIAERRVTRLLDEDASMSDRQIAKLAKVDRRKVTRLRRRWHDGAGNEEHAQ